MAKTSRAQGPSIEPEPPVKIRRTMIGGEPKSVGTNSIQLSESKLKKENEDSQSHQAPAQTTESHSGKEQVQSSTVHLTAGDGQETPEPKSVKKTTPKPGPKHVVADTKKVRIRNTNTADNDFDEFN